MSRIIAGLLGCVLAVATASAQTPDPWQVGVTDAQKAEAQTQLERGNTLYVENRYEDALAAFRAGLAAWKHPSIQFNIAATLIALDRPVEALDELERAMQYGEKPLKDQWREALNYKALLDRQVGTLTVSCKDALEVTLDTGMAIPCPGETTKRVRAGEHVLLAQRAGFLTARRKLTVTGGQHVTEPIVLIALKDAAVTRTRWATWKPWAIAGAGALVGALGLLVELDARSLYDDYAKALADNCRDRACDPADPASGVPTDTLDRARFRERIGVGTMIAGGATLAVGVVLLALNRPYTEVPTEQGVGHVAIVPVASGQGALVGISGTW